MAPRIPALLRHTFRSPAARQRWLRRAGVFIAALLALWLVLWLAVPPILKSQLESQASAKLGRTVRLERVSFSPWSLELELNGLSIAGADGKSPQLSIARLYADLELQSLLRLAPVIDAVSIESPRIHLAHRGDGRYDIDDVIARLAEDDEDKPTPRFSVFNIAIRNGEIDFRDAPVGVTHTVRDFKLDIPFLSNIGSRREVITRPHLSFKLNGNAFELNAATTPFTPSHTTELNISLPRVDIAPYLPYWPARLALRPETGNLQLALKIGFEQKDSPRVVVSGSLKLNELRINETLEAGRTQPLLSLAQLGLDVKEARPLEHAVDVSNITLDAPVIHLRRNARGQTDLERILASFANANTPAKPQAAAAPKKAAPGWTVRVAEAKLANGSVRWEDRSTSPAARVDIDNLALEVNNVSLPVAAPIPLKLSAQLASADLTASGEIDAQTARAQLALKGLPLAAAAPYLRAHLKPALSGALDIEADANWQAASTDRAAAIRVGASRIEVRDLVLRESNATLAGWQSLRAEGVAIDLAQHTASIANVSLVQPQIKAQRDKAGVWMVEQWLAAAPKTDTPKAPAPRAPGSAEPDWAVSLDEVKISDGAMSLVDEKTTRPARLHARNIGFSLRNLKPLARKQLAMPLALRFDIGAGISGKRGEPGQAAFNGTLRLPAADGAAPLQLAGTLRAERFPVHAIEPYFGDTLNLDLLRADLSLGSRIDIALPAAGPNVKLTGDLSIEDLRANTLSPADELLAWKALNLRGLDVEVAAGALKKLVVKETVLSDYFARVIIGADGRINLQDLVRPRASEGPPPPAAPAPTPTASTPPDIRFGPITLVGGRVHYSDRFIQPNYSANLTELAGQLNAFSNKPASDGSPQMAELALRGRAEGSATVDISGTLNPLAKPLALDIKGKVQGLELPPLSPYSAKYAGYGIERGKLSMDVAYRIAPDGMLTASNQIILNQLAFGERSTQPGAPNLPVKLAVALLADRDGVIDLNLPISGSINDPQFSLGPTIVRLIFNLIGKAITSPFSLLASAFGGGEEMSQVPFNPGSAALTDAARTRLATIARALGNRPALQLTVIGQSDLEIEDNGLRHARLEQMIGAEKRRQLARQGGTPPNDVSVSAAEYPALLKAVYKRADIAKPRNAIGIAKDLPDAEMEALLIASIHPGEDAIRALALARAVAVRDYLASQQIAPERLFLGAPAIRRAGEGWAPRAELKLATR